MKRLMLVMACLAGCTDDNARDDASRMYGVAMAAARETKCESGSVAVTGSARESTATFTRCERPEGTLDGTLHWIRDAREDDILVTGTLRWEGMDKCIVNVHDRAGVLSGSLCDFTF